MRAPVSKERDYKRPASGRYKYFLAGQKIDSTDRWGWLTNSEISLRWVKGSERFALHRGLSVEILFRNGR